MTTSRENYIAGFLDGLAVLKGDRMAELRDWDFNDDERERQKAARRRRASRSVRR